jgi:predicted DsbA family dithiol-disulfide isomerase
MAAMTSGGAVPTGPLSVDVVSDVVCPWCYLGKRRLEAALQLAPELDITVHWKPFRLDPTIPREGIERRNYLERKFGSVEAVQPMHDQLAGLGAAAGIEFRFDRITRSPNTVDAHRLIRWSEAEGAHQETVERLFLAYFTEGQDIGDPAVLARIAGDAGLRGEVVDRLRSAEDRAEVEGEIETAYRIGVSGVPCYIVERRYAIMGAQEPPILVQALSEIAAARTN